MPKLFSIKHQYSEKIYTKKKLVEFRRQNVKVKENDVCLIYTSFPVKEITGYFVVKEKIRLSLDKLGKRKKEMAGITKEEFMEYFKGCEEGTAIVFKAIKMFVSGLPLAEIRKKLRGFVPPQSYCNLNESLYSLIHKKLGNKAVTLLDF